MRSLLKTALVVAAVFLVTGPAAFGGYRFIGPGGIGFYRPGFYGAYYRGFGFYGRPYAYGLYGLGYGGYGYGLTVGPALGLGYGVGSGMYGPAYGGIPYGGYNSPYGGYGYLAPGAGYPAGGYGYPAMPYGNGSSSPYATPPSRTESNYPPAQPSTPQQAAPQRELPPPTRKPQQEEAPLKDNAARLTIIVPEGTELWFNGMKTTQTGTRREFDTPPLTPGEDFQYTIKARWTEGGKPVEVTRTVLVRANTSQVIDLAKVSAADSPEK